MPDPHAAPLRAPLPNDPPRIDGDRLWASLMELATIGATPKGGVARLALTDLDAKARQLFMRWAREAGCTVEIDPIGNIRARRPGRDPDRAVVMTGSHIDTQPTGGKFDGNYGVLAGLEVLRALGEGGFETEAPIEVVVWTNEEGSRFVPVMMGSAVFAGACPLGDALAATDADGVTVGEELDRLGFAGAAAPPVRIDSYFEVHIEQGPVLEAAGRTIGAVTGALGQRWFDCTIEGFEAHAGPTPMTLRRDALQAAAAVIQQVVAIARAAGPDARGTVGVLKVHPNSRNVIPGRVDFSIDLRAADEATLDRMVTELEDALALAARANGVATRLSPTSRFSATAFDANCVAAVRRAAERAGHAPLDIVSGAGHDAIHLAAIAPAAMIFIPCRDGVSHNEIERAEPAHVAAGAEVLMHCILERAGLATDHRSAALSSGTRLG